MANPMMLMAQGSDNSTAELQIFDGVISITSPDDFSFDTTFLPASGSPDFNIYKTLTPITPGQVLRADDADDGNFNFKVSMSLTNFTNTITGNVIPFTNFAALTVANNTIDGVDTEPGSPSAGSVNVTAPWSCAWDGQTGSPAANCDADLDVSHFTGNGPLINLDPTSPITDTDTLIPVGDSSLYVQGDVIRLDSNEYALVTAINSPTQIEIQRGVSGTTPAGQGANSGILNIGSESSDIDILVAPEPVGGRIGGYSVGFVIRGLLEPSYLEAGAYSGQITYTLYQCVDLSCI